LGLRLKAFAGFVALIFGALAAIHVYWAIGGRRGADAAIPESDGRPLFRPGRAVTLVVAGLLAMAATFVLQQVGLLPSFGSSLSREGTSAVAVTMIVRAVGDFRYVGFFKRRRGTRFAQLDTRLYSPLALALGVGTAIVAAYR
jgi:Protein of unknown function (DUF3995)